MNDTHTLLTVNGLNKSYGALPVLKDVSFTLGRGERIALIGPSGSGKSTCLRAINFLDPPTNGDIRIDGELIGWRADGRLMTDAELAPQRAEIGMVFQHFHLWPHLSVQANVALQPLWRARRVQQMVRERQLDLVRRNQRPGDRRLYLAPVRHDHGRDRSSEPQFPNARVVTNSLETACFQATDPAA